MKRIVLSAVFFILFLRPLHAAELSSQAEGLFKKYSPAIYQIQSISIESNKKNSIGSGFQIFKGYIVTNYHVVSDSVMTPGSYHIQTIQSDGKEQPARVINFDVVHDIAIIRIENPQETTLPLGSSEINKGKRLFSIGNPEDVGMMIIEGVSNGYMDKALYKKVLTSLPLNPGMSGGPALDVEGYVVGINVMTAGNSLSFLVPVEFLKALWEKTRANHFKSIGNFTAQVQQQLITQETDYLKRIIGRKWERQRFGQFLVPSTLSNEFTCWGEPRDEDEYWIQSPYLDCGIKDNLFISSTVRAHTVSFNYSWIKSKGFDPFRFYTLMNQGFIKSYRFDLDYADERDAENFLCRTDIVKISSVPFWVSTCGRKLKQLPQLYDVNIRMASLGDMDRMMMIEVTLGAITKKTAKSFIQRFYKELEWTK
jgi:serine protease Do